MASSTYSSDNSLFFLTRASYQ